MSEQTAAASNFELLADATDRIRERAARIEVAARRVLTVLDTYGEGNFAEVDDLREALDRVR